MLGKNLGKRVPSVKKVDAIIVVNTRNCDLIGAIMENEFRVSTVKSRSQNNSNIFSENSGGQVIVVESPWCKMFLIHWYSHCSATPQDIS